MHKERTYRWAIMCNDFELETWAYNAIQQLLQESQQEFVAFIVPKDVQAPTTSFVKKLSQYPYKHLLFRFHKRFFLYNDAYVKKPLTALLDPSRYPVIECVTTQKKYSEYFSDEDITTIKSLELDFVVKMGFGIIRGEILNCARYGIWSYHHDDEQVIRGGPPGFWEIYHNHLHQGVILQRIASKLDAGKLIKKALFPVFSHSYNYHLNLIMNESSFLLKKAFIDLKTNPSSFDNLPDITTTAPIYKFPTNITFLLFGLKQLKRKFAFHYEQLFKTEFWKTGLLKKNVDPISTGQINESNITWVTAKDRLSYLADPFVYSLQGKEYVLAEEYSYKKQQAHITRFAVDAPEKQEICIEEPFHLSYPYIFENIDGAIYCLPETASDNSVRLYLLDPTANTFLFKRQLLQNFPAIDPTLFYFNNTYWLFCTRDEECFNTHLYLFHADTLDGPFRSHPKNPIVSDIHCARPGGGVLVRNGKLIRPAQDCSKTYGWKLKFMEVTQLSTTDYAEKEISEITPEQFNHVRGLHNISVSDALTVIDAKYYQFSRINFINILTAKLKKLQRKLFRK
ncbi:hypothetical protein A4H97_33205 [Niastella yeongjuensis]|uniref:Glucosamine inositolphosphorylceramide transferase 1 N-terminal domain-containing protein n=1 Tax=Niastella yeongjuensis TaxID=354355 RepID=A0A1V9EG30_9BACT|nr:hypothetical protein [Niastella yeongjuensis]OQP45022.1 hypothetical protein A4H97_33205 [Niastella yeongjuensis]SEP49034.1 hypothetical protein SAMN05660816_06870 [Niastella yeongjuensis]